MPSLGGGGCLRCVVEEEEEKEERGRAAGELNGCGMTEPRYTATRARVILGGPLHKGRARKDQGDPLGGREEASRVAFMLA